MDITKTQSAIKQILKAYASKREWKEKLKQATVQFDSLIKTLQPNTHEVRTRVSICVRCEGNILTQVKIHGH